MKFVLFVFLLGLSTYAARAHEAEYDDEPELEEPDTTKKFEPQNWVAPEPSGSHYFADCFKDKSGLGSKWIVSKAKKEGVAEDIARYNGEWEVGEPQNVVLKNDYGLLMKNRARHHAASAKLTRSFDFKVRKPLIVEYDLQFQNGHECGGGYVKLLSATKGLKLEEFQDKTPYTIMFGPDKCGMQSKMHFIIRYRNPNTGEYEEKHAKQADKATLLDAIFSDKKSHLVRLDLKSDGAYTIQIDQKSYMSGSLLDSLTPPILPPKEIEDPNDKKPADWDDREKIPDETAKKPEDWDESAPEVIEDESATKPDDWLEDESDLVSDPKAVRPDDWDDEIDGKWEAPLVKNSKCEGVSGCGKWERPKVKNPAYKGKWKPPMVSNPAYKGIWKPRIIANPAYFDEKEPFVNLDEIAAVGLELWTMTDNVMFDNFLITDDGNVADVWAMQTWYLKSSAENTREAKESFFGGLLAAANERPWLWAVLLVVVLIPIVLIVVFCCPGSSKQDTYAKQKKTDEPVPDTAFEEQYAEEESFRDDKRASDDEASKTNPSSSPKRQSPLGSPQRSKDSPKKAATKKADLEAEDDGESSQNEGSETVTPRRSKRSPKE